MLFEPFCPVDTVLFLLFLLYCICVDDINIHSFIHSLYVLWPSVYPSVTSGYFIDTSEQVELVFSRDAILGLS